LLPSRCLISRPVRRLLAVLVLACGSLAQGAEPVTLQLRWQHQFQFAGYYAAQDKGYYREVGLDVTVREAQPGSDPLQDVLDGKAQYGVGTSSLLIRRAAGQPVVVLASIFQHSATALVVRRGPDGKRIPWNQARLMLNPGNFEAQAYLRRNGINPEQLDIRPHSYSYDDLIQGRIDAMAAYLTDAPYVLERANLSYELLNPRTAGIDFYGDVLYTTESELREHP